MQARALRSHMARAGWALAALVLAGMAGFLVVQNPQWTLFDPSFSGRSAVLFAAGLGLLAGVWVFPRLGVVILVVFVFLNLSQVLVRFHQVPSLLRLLVVVLVVAVWRQYGEGRFLRVATQGLALLLALYAAIALLSGLVAKNPALADARFWELTKATLLFLLFGLLAGEPKALRRGAWALVGSAAFLAALGIAQTLTGNVGNEFGGLARIKHAHIYGELFEPRISGPLGDPNFFAQILLIAVPVALCLAWYERSPRLRLVALAGAATIVTATVLTYSRGAGLALAFQALLLLLASKRRLRVAGLGAAALLLFVLFAPADFTRRLTTVQQLLPGDEEVLRPDSSFEERRLFTLAAWKIFLDHPWLGVGAGNYTEHFDEYAARVGSPLRSYDPPGAAHYPHNLYLEIGAETGVLGLGVFLAILITSFVYLSRAHGRFLTSGARDLAGLARALQIALAGYLVSSLFLHGHFLRYLWLVFAFAAALEAVSRAAPRWPDQALGDPATVPAGDPTSRGGAGAR